MNEIENDALIHRSNYGNNWYAEVRGPDGFVFAAMAETRNGVLDELRDRSDVWAERDTETE